MNEPIEHCSGSSSIYNICLSRMLCGGMNGHHSDLRDFYKTFERIGSNVPIE